MEYTVYTPWYTVYTCIVHGILCTHVIHMYTPLYTVYTCNTHVYFKHVYTCTFHSVLYTHVYSIISCVHMYTSYMCIHVYCVRSIVYKCTHLCAIVYCVHSIRHGILSTHGIKHNSYFNVLSIFF